MKSHCAKCFLEQFFLLLVYEYTRTRIQMVVWTCVCVCVCACLCWMYTKRTTLNVIRELNKSYMGLQYVSNSVDSIRCMLLLLILFLCTHANVSIYNGLSFYPAYTHTYTRTNHKTRQQFFHRQLECVAYTRGKLFLSVPLSFARLQCTHVPQCYMLRVCE